MSTQRAKHSRTASAAQVSSSRGGRSTTAALASRPTSMPTHEKNDMTVKAMVSERVNDDLRRFARENGYQSVSDCVRELLMVALYGQDHLLTLHQRRIRALAQNLAGIGRVEP